MRDEGELSRSMSALMLPGAAVVAWPELVLLGVEILFAALAQRMVLARAHSRCRARTREEAFAASNSRARNAGRPPLRNTH